MTELTITHAGYTYRLVHEQGNRYVAYYQHEGQTRSKTRLCRGDWRNGNQKRVQDAGTIEALEDGVKALQRMEAKGPRPPIISGGEHYTPPPVRSKGHKSRREPRGNGRVE